jgi:hypothetical protein
MYLCPHLILSEIPTLLFGQPIFHQNNLKKSISLCLVCPLKPYIPSHSIPLDLASLLTSFEDIFVSPTRLPPICSIEPSIDLIPRATFPNAPSYLLASREAKQVEFHLQQLLNTGYIQLISSHYASYVVIIPNK